MGAGDPAPRRAVSPGGPDDPYARAQTPYRILRVSGQIAPATLRELDALYQRSIRPTSRDGSTGS